MFACRFSSFFAVNGQQANRHSVFVHHIGHAALATRVFQLRTHLVLLAELYKMAFQTGIMRIYAHGVFFLIEIEDSLFFVFRQLHFLFLHCIISRCFCLKIASLKPSFCVKGGFSDSRLGMQTLYSVLWVRT